MNSQLDLGGKWLYIVSPTPRGGVVRQAHHFLCAKRTHDRGVEQLEARRAHNPKVAGSSPAPATKNNPPGCTAGRVVFHGSGRIEHKLSPVGSPTGRNPERVHETI